MMSIPEVSVVIPAYNSEKWLRYTVDSVLAQTFTNWEAIIINDGSTDGTLLVAHSYEDPRIKVIDQANAGVSAARNAGIAEARGNYITFLDADDVMLTNCLEVRLASLKERPTDWMYCDLGLCDENLNPTGEVWTGVDDDALRTLLLQLERAVPGAGSNVMAHRHCFDNGAIFDEHLSTSADQDFSMQLARRFTYHRLPQVLNLYRILPDSMSKNVALYERDHLYLFRKVRDQGLLDDTIFRHQCMGNVYWAIGGSWWLLAGKRRRALKFLIRALLYWPPVIIRPIHKRIQAGMTLNQKPDKARSSSYT